MTDRSCLHCDKFIRLCNTNKDFLCNGWIPRQPPTLPPDDKSIIIDDLHDEVSRLRAQLANIKQSCDNIQKRYERMEREKFAALEEVNDLKEKNALLKEHGTDNWKAADYDGLQLRCDRMERERNDAFEKNTAQHKELMELRNENKILNDNNAMLKRIWCEAHRAFHDEDTIRITT